MRGEHTRLSVLSAHDRCPRRSNNAKWPTRIQGPRAELLLDVGIYRHHNGWLTWSWRYNHLALLTGHVGATIAASSSPWTQTTCKAAETWARFPDPFCRDSSTFENQNSAQNLENLGLQDPCGAWLAPQPHLESMEHTVIARYTSWRKPR